MTPASLTRCGWAKKSMQQPDFLKTDDVVPWAWGRGNAVWAMFEAAAGGDVARMQQLVAQDDDLIRCMCDYRTPLHYAVRENQLEAAQWLIERGADATYRSGQDWHDAPRQLAADRGYDQMVAYLDDHLKEQYGICQEGETIAQAIRQRELDRVKELIQQHGTRVADARGNKPIHWATMTRQMDLIRFLLRQAVDINAQRPDGARPLDLTGGDYWYRGWRDSHPDAIKNHWVVVGFLIAKGADYDMTTACRLGDIEQVRHLLDEDPDAAKAETPYCTWYSGYPLRSAVAAGHTQIVKLLLKHGFDPNHQEHGLAPYGASLYEAVAGNHTELIDLLLEHGADPNQEVESSGSCLYRADESVRTLLRDHGAIWDLYGCCYEGGHADDLAVRFQRNPQEADNASAFALAAQRGDREIVDLFLKYQSDLWQRMPACAGQSEDILSWMMDQGMNIQQTDWHGVHALHHANDIETAKRLLAHGADINVIDGEHQSTPLGWAARRGNSELAQFLIEQGADKNAAGAPWARPLQWANRRRHETIIQLLTPP